MECSMLPWQNCKEVMWFTKNTCFPCLSVVDLSRNSSANFKLVRRSTLLFAFELPKIPDRRLGLHYSTQQVFSLKTSFSIGIEVQTPIWHQELSRLSHVLRFVLSFVGSDKHSAVGILQTRRRNSWGGLYMNFQKHTYCIQEQHQLMLLIC